MSKNPRLRKALLFGLAPLVIIAVIVPAIALAHSSSAPAAGTDWDKVQTYINNYITKQYNAADEGEAGFYVDQAALKTSLDSNNDGTILGEGDDLANAPVLVDNLNQLTTMIPGTSFRCNWNSAIAGNNCFEAGAVADVKTLVNNHEAATGKVPDIIDYCMTDHTAAPTTGAWGFIAQTGGLGGTSVPKVYGFKWGRDGWTNTPVNLGSTTVGGIYTYPVNNQIGAAGTTSTYSPPSTVPGSCTSASGDAELMRCVAQWAITSTQGNVGNGQSPAGVSPAQTLTAGQIVDIRVAPSPSQTVVNGIGGPPAVQIPINTIFSTGLTNVNPSATDGVLIASASQGPGGIVAEGLKMLGYTTATGGFIHSGVPYWNNTMSVNQGQHDTGVSYPLQTVSPLTAYANADTAPANISGVSVAPTDTSATITWTTDKPATSVVEYGTSPGVYTNKINDTILHGSHSVNLTGLSPSTTYYYKVTSYDNQALPAATPEATFTTVIPRGDTDYVYYFPWYDTTGGFGAGSWINISNTGASDVTASLRLGGAYKESFPVPAGGEVNKIYFNTIGGPVEVRCVGCQAAGNHLTVAQRALYNGSFNETIAPEHTEAIGGTSELGTAYAFPWYDNQHPGFAGINNGGDWIIATNADPTTDAVVDVYVGGVLKQTLGPIAPYTTNSSPMQIDPSMAGGPIKVVSRNGQPVVVTQRVLYYNSFNETFGRKIS